MSLKLHVIHCDGPPTIPPTQLGQHWIDTLNEVAYISVGTSSLSDWVCQSERLIKLMNCSSTVVVDDLVYQSPSTNNLAISTIDNTTLQPVIGHVITKPTATTCIVQLKGILPFTVPRGRLFLSISGGYTNTPPTNSGGYIQELGWSCGDGRIEINPNPRRVKRA